MNKKFKILIVLVLIPFVIYFWPASLGGNTSILIVQGNSMLPNILPGSLIVAKEAPEYYVDDIIAYKMDVGGVGEKNVVHRIIEDTPRGFVIKGDNNSKKDSGYYTKDDIIGKIEFSTPYVGDALGLLRNPIVLVVAAAMMFGVQSEKNRRKKKKEKMRHLMYGIPYNPKKKKAVQKKLKKPDYTMFFAAIFFNVATYIAIHVSLQNDITPEGDAVTGFLYIAIVPELASNLILAFYFAIIFGLYFLAKSQEKKISRHLAIAASSGQTMSLIKKKQTNYMLTIASSGWLLFILLSLFHLMAVGKDLIPIFT